LARGEFEANRQTHFVADGDTLARLAQRYLGSADRSEEIFAANRHVLENPRLLPIGVELTIPTSPPQSGNVAFTNGPPRAHLQGPVSTHTGYRGQP
jgi:phage tail protein X